MKKFLLNPNDPNAFTSEVIHKVVLNGINFELPEHIWDAIDDAFGYYWNVEVGYGGCQISILQSILSRTGCIRNILFLALIKS